MRHRCPTFPVNTPMYRWVLFDDFPFNFNLNDEMDQQFRNFLRTRPTGAASRPGARNVEEPRQIPTDNTTTTNEKEKKKNKVEKEPLCCICLNRKIEIVLIPCGHYKYCEKCAEHIKTCSVCRTKIIGRQKVFP